MPELRVPWKRKRGLVTYTPDVPKLDFVSRFTILLGDPLTLGPGPQGERRVVPILGGTFAGPKLSGSIRPGGADWQIVAPNGLVTIDTRYTLDSLAGPIFTATTGVRVATPEVMARISLGEEVSPDEYYFRLVVKLESGIDSLWWVNNSIFIAKAERGKSQVAYDLFAVL